MLMAANAPMLAKKGMADGDPVGGYLPGGSIAGVIEDLPNCAELIDRHHGRSPRDSREAHELRSAMAIDIEIHGAIGELVINNPPVNALSSAGWREFADGMTDLGQRE